MALSTLKFHILTFGCQMNEHDSFRMAEILRACGYEDAQSLDEADLILINTCSVRKNPENKVYSMLGTLRRLKDSDRDIIIGVAGCVAQQEGERILQREKCVDLVFGPDHYFRLPEMLERVKHGERVLETAWSEPSSKSRVDNFIPEEWLEAGHLDGCKAYVSIMKGCNNFCSFCIVPHTRGRETCRPLESILKEVEALVHRGAKEIWLLGQNVNSYRANEVDFYTLLDTISSQEGVVRVRFTSSHPKDWDEKLTTLVATRRSICNQLHLPLQSGSDRILDLMNRRHTFAQYFSIINDLKTHIPTIELSTDIIVGFPTEKEEDFQATLRALEEIRFSSVFSFKYSPRPGTRAAAMSDDVPRSVKEERLQRLIELQEKINREHMDSLVGTVQEVLIDSCHKKNPNVLNGRTEGYRPVKLSGSGLKIGDRVSVRITGYRNHWLEGVVV